ncbi:MAG: SURF1 family protein [Burkholderiales bacterium]
MTCAALLGVAATVSLGRWQLSRAAQKEALQAAIEERQAMPPLTGAEWTDQEPATLLHRPVVLKGRLDAEHTVFLDNRQMHGRPGFYVLTPLKLEHSAAAVIVQRGWVPRNFVDRAALPKIATPDGVVEIEGRIAPAPAKLFEFEGHEAGRIRQNLDLAAFGSETGLALLPLSILQTEGESDDGLLRDWPAPALGVEKHYGYAFQWFGLCSLIVFLYVWFQFIQPRRSARATRNA